MKTKNLQLNRDIENKPKHAGGRPSDYNKDITKKICLLLSEGKSLRSVCSMPGMPSRETVFTWLNSHKEFLDQYARAKEECSDLLAEEMLEIADESLEESKTGDAKRSGAKVQAMRLRVDTRKWIASKLKPKKYGEKLALAGDSENPLTVNIISYKKK